MEADDGGKKQGHPTRKLTVYNVKTKQTLIVNIIGDRMVTTRGGIAHGYEADISTSMVCGVHAFVLLKGSTVSMQPTPSCQSHILNLRKDCAEILTGNIVNRDSLFTSSTAASNFVCFGASNGNEAWKKEAGSDYESESYD